MQPESSDGFASVGTILPKEEAALLPGGLFASGGGFWGADRALTNESPLRLVVLNLTKQGGDADNNCVGLKLAPGSKWIRTEGDSDA